MSKRKYLTDELIESFAEIDMNLFFDLSTTFLLEKKTLLDNINKAIESNDSLKLAESAHALKGSLSVFDLKEIATALKTIEVSARQNLFRQAVDEYKNIENLVQDFCVELAQFLQESKLTRSEDV